MIETDVFICPKCGKDLWAEGKSYYCENNHCYDVSRHGYVNLLLSNQKNSLIPGDNAEMISARVKVMNANYYKSLADAIIYLMRNENKECIVDAGCGVGYISKRLKDEFSDTIVVGTDISKSAIEQASKKFKGAIYAVASSKRLPVKSNCADAIVCAFAPIYGDEFLRVSKDNGFLFHVVPGRNHLRKLKEFLYGEVFFRENEMEPIGIKGYDFLDKILIKDTFCGDKEIIKSLIKMTPYYYHTSKEKLEKLEEIDEFETNLEFDLRVYKRGYERY